MTSGDLRELRGDACRQLLESEYLGRLAYATNGHVEIFPMNYVFTDGAVVVRTSAGTKDSALTVGRPVVFEIDGVDDIYHGGWSVVVRGRVERMAPGHYASLRPWPDPDGREQWLRIVPEEITGRAFGPPVPAEAPPTGFEPVSPP